MWIQVLTSPVLCVVIVELRPVCPLQKTMNSFSIDTFATSIAPTLSLDDPAMAKALDSVDPLAKFRAKFQFPTLGSIPIKTEGNPLLPVIYMCGNSLGLKPKTADVYMQEQLDAWGNWGVEMHFQVEIVLFSFDVDHCRV